MEEIRNLLREEQQQFFQRNGIVTISVATKNKGIAIAKKILLEIIDKRTVVYLSGGKTPKSLYELLRVDESFLPGAVGMIDERYGKKLHKNSNELLLKETGLLQTLALQGISFYPILTTDVSSEVASDNYDQKVREFLAQYRKGIGILGIGADGHTAGLLPNGQWVMDTGHKTNFITSYESNDQFKERITMTFLGLSLLDCIILLAFGEDKKHALEMMFTDGSEKEVPARFYTRPEIAKKTIVITDQKV